MESEYEDFLHTKYGYCYYYLPPDATPIIFNLYINSEYRRKGHARKLLTNVIGIIRDAGYLGDILIEVSPRENSINPDDLEKFYQSLGLVVIDKIVSDGSIYKCSCAIEYDQLLRDKCLELLHTLESNFINDMQALKAEVFNVETKN